MSYTQTERNAIKKKAKELATILGDDFSDLENQSKDMQTDFLKNTRLKQITVLFKN